MREAIQGMVSGLKGLGSDVTCRSACEVVARTALLSRCQLIALQTAVRAPVLPGAVRLQELRNKVSLSRKKKLLMSRNVAKAGRRKGRGTAEPRTTCV